MFEVLKLKNNIDSDLSFLLNCSASVRRFCHTYFLLIHKKNYILLSIHLYQVCYTFTIQLYTI